MIFVRQLKLLLESMMRCTESNSANFQHLSRLAQDIACISKNTLNHITFFIILKIFYIKEKYKNTLFFFFEINICGYLFIFLVNNVLWKNVLILK